MCRVPLRFPRLAGLTSWSRHLGEPIAGIDKAPGSWSWSAGQAALLDPASLSLYASAHDRVFFVVAILQSDTPEAKAQASAAQAWLDANGSVVATMTFYDSYYGPITVALYQLR